MLPLVNRLRKKSEIQNVFRQGKAVYSGFLALKFKPSSETATRFSFSIGHSYSKKAVDRNRLRRILRETVRENLNKLKKPADLVFFLVKSNRQSESFEKPQIEKQIARRAIELMKKAEII